jgi:hypothetical protein
MGSSGGHGGWRAAAAVEAGPLRRPPARTRAGLALPPTRICGGGTGGRGRVVAMVLPRGGERAGRGHGRVRQGRESARGREVVGLQRLRGCATGEADCILQLVLQHLLEREQ